MKIKKDYLIQSFQRWPEVIKDAREGDLIDFDMPSFCSGDYSAKIFKDEFGLYINSEDNSLDGCRDFRLKKKK